MDGQPNAGHPYNGVSLSLKKNGHSDTCYNTEGPRACALSEVSPSQQDTHCMSPTHLQSLEKPGSWRQRRRGEAFTGDGARPSEHIWHHCAALRSGLNYDTCILPQLEILKTDIFSHILEPRSPKSRRQQGYAASTSSRAGSFPLLRLLGARQPLAVAVPLGFLSVVT